MIDRLSARSMITLSPINLAVVGADRRGRICLLAPRPENGLR